MQKNLGKKFAKQSLTEEKKAEKGGNQSKKNKKEENLQKDVENLDKKEKDKFEKSDDEEKGGISSGKQSDQLVDPNKITLLVGTSSRGSKGDEETNKDDIAPPNPLAMLIKAQKLKQVNATDNDGEPIIDEEEDS